MFGWSPFSPSLFFILLFVLYMSIQIVFLYFTEHICGSDFYRICFISVRSRTLLQFNEDTVENDHYEESNASDILLSKISNLVIQNENYNENEIERIVPDNFKNNRMNSLDNEHTESNGSTISSVIEIDEKDFSSKWRTAYSDEM